jgi:putative aldouronate transport system permease protein
MRMFTKMKRKFNIYTLVKGMFIILVSISIIYPFVYMIAISLSNKIYVVRNQVFIWPMGVNISAFKGILRNETYFLDYMNTIIYVISGTLVSISITAMGAYALSKNKLIFRKTFMVLVIVCLYFSGGMIPTFLVVKQLGLINTRFAMILPNAVSFWNLFIMIALFSTIPKDIEDSATIDGVGYWGCFRHVTLPLSTAAFATISLFYAVNIWNDYLSPMIYLNSPGLFPLTIYIAKYNIFGSGMHVSNSDQAGSDSVKFAVLLVTMLPILCAYPFLQKYFVKGMLVGSLKG